MLSCKEVTRKIASDELAKAGWKEHFAVRLHLLGCRYCRRYAAQLRALGAAARNVLGARSEDAQTLERLEREILERSLGGSEASGRTGGARHGNVDPE